MHDVRQTYLITALNEYLVGNLPFFVRWFVRFKNVKGNKQLGIERLMVVAEWGNYFRPFAKILLAAIYLREKRLADARSYVAELVEEYPEIFRKELAMITKKLSAKA